VEKLLVRDPIHCVIGTDVLQTFKNVLVPIYYLSNNILSIP